MTKPANPGPGQRKAPTGQDKTIPGTKQTFSEALHRAAINRTPRVSSARSEALHRAAINRSPRSKKRGA
jgi:hypothetical protein